MLASYYGAEQVAFDEAKRLLTTSPLFIAPNPNRDCILHTDASLVGVGGTQMLDQREMVDKRERVVIIPGN